MKGALIVALAAGLCSYSAWAAAPALSRPSDSADPSRLVLRLGELPSGFRVSTRHAVTNATVAGEEGRPISLYARRGRVTGYEIEFARNASSGSLPGGAMAVTSSASVYRTSGGASLSLADTRAACRAPPAETLSLGARIGDEAVLCGVAQESAGVTAQVYVVAWRHGDLKLAVMIAGLEGDVSPGEAVRLARTLDRRIERRL